jgi:hypothetical protein
MQTMLYLCGAGYFGNQPRDHMSPRIKEAAALLDPGEALVFNLDEHILSLIQDRCVVGQHALTRNEAHILLAVFDHHPAITPDYTLVIALESPHLHHYYKALFAKDKQHFFPGEVSQYQRWTIERAVARLRKKLRGTFQMDLARITSAAGYLLVPWGPAKIRRVVPQMPAKLLA